MRIDLALAILLAVLGGLGMWSGAIRQLAHLGGLVLGFFFARPLAALVGPPIAQALGYPQLLTTIGVTFVTFFLTYAVAVLALRVLLEKVLPDGERGELNRTGGLALGLLKGLVIGYVLMCGLAVVEKPLASVMSSIKGDAKKSYALGFARRHNVLTAVPLVRGLERLSELSKTGVQDLGAEGQVALAGLQNDPRVQSLLEDPRVREAVESGDRAALLVNPKVRALLEDAEIRERIKALAD